MRKYKIIIVILSLALVLTNSIIISNAKEKLNYSKSEAKVKVLGEIISVYAYNINGYNFFKLRDFAKLLKESKNEFGIEYNSKEKSIEIIPNSVYLETGEELKTHSKEIYKPIKSNDNINKNKQKLKLEAYKFGGNNYYKLRDLSSMADIDIDWDEEKRLVVLNLSKVDNQSPENNKNDTENNKEKDDNKDEKTTEKNEIKDKNKKETAQSESKEVKMQKDKYIFTVNKNWFSNSNGINRFEPKVSDFEKNNKKYKRYTFFHTETSGSVIVKAGDVSVNGNDISVNVFRKSLQEGEYGTANMAYYTIDVAIVSEEINENTKISLNFVEKRDLTVGDEY